MNNSERDYKELEDYRLDPRILRIMLVVFAVVFLVWLCIGPLPWLLIDSYPKLPSSSERISAFGSSFTFIESLFSGLAFAGVIIAIWLQTQELRLQRRELQDTREELRKSANAQEQMQRAMTLTSYLTAAAALSQSYEIGAERLIEQRFESTGCRQYRLAIHLDWLLNSLRSGDIPQQIEVKDHRELRFALISIVSEWDRWWRAIGHARINDYDVDFFVRNITNVSDTLQGIIAVFPEHPEIFELRRSARRLCEHIAAGLSGAYFHDAKEMTHSYDRNKLRELAIEMSTFVIDG